LEDMVATTKRHPSRTHIKTGWTRDGQLVVQEIDFRIDGGAYMTLSPVVLSRGGLHAAGPYACDHVRVRARAAATNTPPHGAFRGFGAPQSVFAIERHMDEAAAKLGLSEIALRKKNLVRDGQALSTGQVLRENVDMRAILDRALLLSGYEEKRARYDIENRRAEGGPGGARSHLRRGVGVATFMHGAGFTGSGERYLASRVTVDCDATGQVFVRASSTEIGQGTNTIFTQIAAEILGLLPDSITVVRPDTAQVPNSGPTVASRTVMVVGGLVAQACRALKARLQDPAQGASLLAAGAGPAEVQAAVQAYVARHGSLSVTTQYEQPPDVQWDDKAYRGDAYATYAWAAYVAEVEVDLLTYETRVLDFVAVQEVGKVVHPILAAGQIEGGVAQGVGFALYEKVAWREGRMANGQMTNYIMPTSADVPPIRVDFVEVENPRLRGPRGAKGIGELPLDGTAPAILNAVAQATGLAVNQIPLLPEDLLAAAVRAGVEMG
jgi:CO/xanthine dehydrogenase Mo-binding subunit